MHCGSGLAPACVGCGAAVPGEARFCPRCGRAIEVAATSAPAAPPRTPRDYTPRHLAERILSSKSALEGERKQVTVLFADVQGSMALSEELDPEEWHRILDRFFTILSEGVHRFEGTVNQYTGDGIMAIFGAPIAHEDHAHRACYAALHLREAVREYANEVRVSHGVSFGVRLGLNSGEVIVGKIGDDLRMDYTAQGHVVGLAQRMEALAESGHICLAEPTARLVQGYFELQDLGRIEIKGVSEPVGLYELEGVGPFRTRLDRSRARGLSTFVGRDDEMATLKSALDHALEGQGRIIGVVAEAGVGKSRLCSEFVEYCRAREIVVHEAHCPPHGRTIPMLPILELLRGYFDISETDEPRAARERIAGNLLLLDRELERFLPLVWDLMRIPDPERPGEELDPDVRQQRLYEVVRRVVRLRSERDPVVHLIDDLHWIDAASDGFLAQLADAVRGTRSLLLVNFRPEYRAEWMQRADYQQLPLSPLGTAAIRELLRSLLGSDPSVAALPEAIEARAAGNPFFTEEVVQALIESDHLEGQRGAYRLVSPVEHLEIPDTVHAVLAARIDRLVELEKRVLQMAAVIDRNFARPLLGEISDLSEPELDAALRALCDGEFIYERALYPVAEYAFKHPLTHEVAYASQLSDRRRSLHAALARALEGSGAGAALLAHHWDEAGEAEPAVHWHRLAAEASGFLSESDTLRHWGRVRALLADLPESPENLSLAANARSQTLWIELRQGLEAEVAETLFEEASALAERAGDRAALASARRSYAIYRLYTAQSGGPALAEQAVIDADASGDRSARIATRWAAAAAQLLAADVELAMTRSSEGLELCGDDLDVGADAVGYSPWIFFHAIRACARAYLGRPAEAISELERALGDYGEKHRMIQAICNSFGVQIHELTGDRRAALACGRRAVESEFLSIGGQVWAHYYLGVAQVLSEQWDEALASLDHSLSTALKHRTFLHMQPEILVYKAQTLHALGDAAAALGVVEEALEIATTLEMRRQLVKIYCTRARVLGSMGADGLERAEADLDVAVRMVEECAVPGMLPGVHVERAGLYAQRGDAAGRRRELEAAHRLYREMEALPNAERIARELES
jgi:class 3 adenylate cyclase/tetratricopeptide (TPR) repeat protein